MNVQDRQPPRKGLAHRMGRWSARHRKIAIWGWLAFVIVSFAIGTVVGTKNIDPDTSGSGEAGRMWEIVATDFEQPVGESVLVQSNRLTMDDQAFSAALGDAIQTLEKQPNVTNIRSPLGEEGRTLIGQEGHAALIQFDIKGDPDDAEDKIDPILAATDRVQAAHPDLFVGQIGGASGNKAINGVFEDDLAKAGLLSIPVTLIILLLTFGSLVAASIPLMLALTAVFATLGLLAIPSHIVPMDESVGAVVLLIGLAVGVDYSMFYLKREREERARGRSEQAALEAAEATSGRAVLISGATVIISMAGMFFTRDATFMSFAVAMILVVAIAMLGSVTVLPALLSWLGDRVDKLAIPGLHRMTRPDGESRFWGWILERVLRRPVVSVLLAGGLLVALALPVLGLKTTIPGTETYPPDLPVMKVYNRVQDAFPGTVVAALAVIKAPNVNSPEVQEAMGQLEWRALASGVMHEPIERRINDAGTVATISIPIDGGGTDEPSVASLEVLRNEIMPVTLGAIEGAEAGVTGDTAFTEDFNAQMRSSLPWVFAFVLGFAFILLLASFRSIVVAIKAILLNLLSVGAAYGVTVLIFQHGYGKDLLGFEFEGGIVAFLPIFLFVILFGLSMDYHVFILSRVRESVDSGMSTDEAVAHGIKSTAGVVTSAAIVMVFVFSIFATLQLLFLKEFGVGLATAVLIDATIVRAVLLPASMKLLGDWNWYLPKWLDWLPHLEHGERVSEAQLRPSG